MKNYFYMLVLCVLCSGCLTTAGVEKRYQALNVSDGVDQKEAQIIAQQKLIHSSQRKDYQASEPNVIEDAISHQYPDYWFVDFEAKKFDMTFWHYLVVIEKKTGEVIFANVYSPFNSVDYDWVFRKK